VESLRPARIVSIHSITGDRYGNNYDGPADELARLMQTHNKYRVMKSIGYPTPGSFGSWAGVDRQIPTITLELPHDEPGPSCWERNREALLAVIRAAEVGK
jgi:murein peptide amidase A